MRMPPSPLLPDRDRLDCVATKGQKRRRFLATCLASVTVLALPGCDAPTFDSSTGTLTFRRRYSGSGRN
jgi:hypothetical protein